MMKFKVLICQLCIVGCILHAESYAGTYMINGDSSEYRGLNKYLEVFVDSTKTLNHDQVNKLNDHQFIPFQEVSLPLSPEYAYWARITLHNLSEHQSQWMLHVGQNDFIDVYDPNSKGQYQILKSGYLYPASVKTVNLGSYYVPVSINAQTPKQLLIRIEETVHKDPEFDIRLETTVSWAQKNSSKLWLDFMFQGIIWIMILYNLLVYLNSRQKASLYYGIYLVLIAIVYLFLTGLLRQYVLKETPQLVPYTMALIPLSACMYYVFMLDFLDIPHKLPQWQSRVIMIIWADFFLFFFVIIFYLFVGHIVWTARIVQVTTLANCAVALFVTIKLFRRNDMLARYFIAGTISFIISVIFDISYWMPSTSEAIVTRFGLIGEILFFSVGLGQKIRVIEREKRKTQYELIKQLKINEKLSRDSQIELEKSIQQRTAELQERNYDLAIAIEKAEHAARAKSEFLSVMSHEIRTPMNAVIGTIHLLLTENPKEAQLEKLNTLKFSAQHLLLLINDILDFSKIESGNLELETTPFSIKELMLGISSVYQYRAKEKDIEFKIELDPDIPDALIGDPARLTQILNNLISNAFKFTDEGHVHVLINSKGGTKKKAILEFIVEDTGIGIPEHKQKIIFESFKQAESDTTRKYGGTGLGLAITKKLLKIMKGDMSVRSTPGEGSQFLFAIKLKINQQTKVSARDDKEEKLMAVKDKKFLLVDDNEINLKLVDRIITNWGANCILAESGNEALEKIEKDQFDIMLLDLQMPEMDGFQVAETIRARINHGSSDIPIIALSAESFTNVGSDLSAAGIDDFVAKPFNPKELLDIVYLHLKD